MNKRASVFFVFDVFIAATILVITLTMILGADVSRPSTEKSYLLSEDVMSFLSENMLREIDDPVKDALYQDGNITNLDQTPLEQFAVFHYRNVTEGCTTCQANSSILFESLTAENIPSQYNVYLAVNGTEIFIRENPALSPSFSYTSRAFAFPLITKSELWGPVLVELRVEG